MCDKYVLVITTSQQCFFWIFGCKAKYQPLPSIYSAKCVFADIHIFVYELFPIYEYIDDLPFQLR